MMNDENEDTYFADLPEEEVRAALAPPPPWVADDYDASIKSAISYQSDKEGSFPCVKIEVVVSNSDGKTKTLPTWVLSKNPKPGAIKGGLEFLKAVGLSRTDYRNPVQLVGLTGKVRLGIKDGTDGNKYNEIKYFLSQRK